jgi:hypothetical protein
VHAWVSELSAWFLKRWCPYGQPRRDARPIDAAELRAAKRPHGTPYCLGQFKLAQQVRQWRVDSIGKSGAKAVARQVALPSRHIVGQFVFSPGRCPLGQRQSRVNGRGAARRGVSEVRS